MKKSIILSVTNDLTSEQRVHKVCLTLLKMGFDVTMVGRLRKKSLPLRDVPYKTARMSLIFDKGPLFYAEYNLRLFLFLLFRKADLLVANDLDTLLANYLVARLKGAVLIHDSHEYFTGVPELEGRAFARGFWKGIERWIFPKLKYVYTVNDSIADLYRVEYGLQVKVVRNFPLTGEGTPSAEPAVLADIPKDLPIVLYQGSVNLDRGLMEAVEAMPMVHKAILLVVGDGDVIGQVKEKVRNLGLEKRVIFVPRVPFRDLAVFTARASIGLSLDKDTNLNYRFSLPNKIFDYARAGVPVLASSLPEIIKVFSKYEIGRLAENHTAAHLADRMNNMLTDVEARSRWKKNCELAAKEYCWENEERVLKEIFSEAGRI